MSALAQVLSRLPAAERGPLVLQEGMQRIPATLATDPDWLEQQVALRGQRWRTDDRRVLATLWWYSASVWVQAPSIASLVLADAPLSPLLPDVELHWSTDSTVNGATSSRALDGDPVPALGLALRESFGDVIAVLARVGRMKERPLWAIASDSLAGRALWVGKASGQLDRTTAVARELAAVIGGPLPVPRWVDVPPVRFTRRCSCCLLYQAPDQDKCSSCPKLAPLDRRFKLELAAERERRP